jgi:predicted Zn-dependent peptidase
MKFIQDRTSIGTKIRHIHQPSSNFSIGVIIPYGSAHDTNANVGSAHYLEHLVLRSHNSVKNSENVFQLEQKGGNINAYTETTATTYLINGKKDFLFDYIQQLTSVLGKPQFTQEQFDTERMIIEQEFKELKDTPCAVVDFLLSNQLVQPRYAMENGYGIGALSSFTPKQLIQTWERHYDPAHMTICSCGDLDEYSYLMYKHAIEELVKKLKRKNQTTIARNPPVGKKNGFETAQLGTLENTYIGFGYHSPIKLTTESYIDEIVEKYMSDGDNSFLNRELREKRGLIYSIDIQTEQSRNFNCQRLCLGINRESIDLVRRIFTYGLEKSYRLSKKEFNRTKERFLNNLQTEFSTKEIVTEMIDWEINGRGSGAFARRDEIYREITYDEYVSCKPQTQFSQVILKAA